ncbi:MAG TPA: DUF177 domain-containing protein [Edaphocola sp.]|nr:DUF177 domain-containing protein [Edaphocola sp.]
MTRKYHRAFEIAYFGLKEGLHTYDYKIDKSFFETIGVDGSEFEEVDVDITVSFLKHTNFFELKFIINGFVEVACDRCGDLFKLPLWDEFDLIIKLKERTGQVEEDKAEDDGDIVFLSKTETVIDLSEWIYEFLTLSIPMHRLHPDDENGNSTCNKENLALLEEMRERVEKNEIEKEEESNKIIWKGLEAFKDSNKNKH